MTDTSQCFSAKAVSSNRSEVFECLQLRSGEPLAEDGQVVSLSRDEKEDRWQHTSEFDLR